MQTDLLVRAYIDNNIAAEDGQSVRAKQDSPTFTGLQPVPWSYQSHGRYSAICIHDSAHAAASLHLWLVTFPLVCSM